MPPKGKAKAKPEPKAKAIAPKASPKAKTHPAPKATPKAKAAPKVSAYTKEDEENVKAIFERFDTNGDGTIDRSEFGEILKVLDPKTWDDTRIAALFQACDVDKSQNIEIKELCNWIFGGAQSHVLEALRCLDKEEIKAKEWAALDAAREEDRTLVAERLESQVGAGEIEVSLPSTTPGASCNADREKERASRRERVVNLFQKYDTSSDGSISSDELKSVLIDAGIDETKTAKILSDVDLDKDQRIDYNEFVLWLFEGKSGAGSFSPEQLRKKMDLENSAEVCVFLLGDRRVANENDLVEKALNSVTPGELAMQPLAAEAGQDVVRHAAEFLDPNMKQSSEDEMILRQLFHDSMPRSAIIDSVVQVAAADATTRFLRKIAQDRSAVQVTFHATAQKCVRSIAEGGLSVDATSTKGKLYGLGAYVASHAGLAHKYSQPVGGKKGQRFMFCVLVDTGEVVQGVQDTRCRGTTVDQQWNPTQYCLVDADRLLVTHLITYRNNGGAEYEFESALRNAVTRSAEREQRAGRR